MVSFKERLIECLHERLQARIKTQLKMRFDLSLIVCSALLLGGLFFNHLALADDASVTWAQLSSEQRQVLNPLASEWDTLRPWQREKMLDIARDYPKMNASKQDLVQKRLSNWSRMTPYERENARKKHQQFNSLSVDKKNELRKKWMEYQSLSEAERAKLRAESPDTYTDADLN